MQLTANSNSPAMTMMRGSTLPSMRGRIGIIRKPGRAAISMMSPDWAAL